jgi:hypothetical protein
MNREIEPEYEEYQEQCYHQCPNKNLDRWQDYIKTYGYDRNIASNSNIARLALCEYFKNLELDGKSLFHMTTVYNPYANREYGVSDVNQIRSFIWN